MSLYVYIFCQISENFSHYFLSIFSVLSSLSPLRTLMARILDLLLWSQDPWGFLFKALLSNFRLFWVSVIQLGSFYCFVFHLTVSSSPSTFLLSLTKELFILVLYFSVSKFPLVSSFYLVFLYSVFLLFHLFQECL